jgi:ribosomal subunit interface protein
MIHWNIATKEISLGITLQNRIKRIIAKLEKHLKSFPPDTVHLQIVLEKQKRKERFTTALILYLPPGVLRTEKTSKDALESLTEAVHALLRELEELKSKLRREPLWKRRARRAELHDNKAKFAAEPSSQPAKDEVESIKSLLERFYPRLLDYIRRHIRRSELEDEIPRGKLEPEAILDSVAEKALKVALKEAHSGDGTQDCLLLLHTLAAQELRRRITAIRAERSVRRINTARRGVADRKAQSPDEIAVRKDLVQALQTVAQHWPKDEHELFDLYFKGSEPDEIATIKGQSISQVEEDLQEMQARFRGILTDENWEATTVAG